MAVLFRGGRAVFKAIGRSARELRRKITRQSPSYPNDRAARAERARQARQESSGGISSITFHRRAVQSADRRGRRPGGRSPAPGQRARVPTRALTRTSLLQRGVAVRREGGIVDSTLSPTRQRVTPLEHFFDLVFVSAFA